MRTLILSLLCLFISALCIAQEPPGTRWDYIYAANYAAAAAATETDVWFAVDDYFLRVDRATRQINWVRSPFIGSPSTRQLWVDDDQRVVPVLGNQIGFPEGEEEWSEANVNFNGLYLVDRLIGREANGDFLFLGRGVIDLFRWRPGESPVMANDLREPIPWRVDHIVWDEGRQVYWAANETSLGYVETDGFIEISLPENSGEIEELRVDRDAALWVRTRNLLLLRKNDQWISYPLTSATTEVAFTTAGDGTALLVDGTRRLLLTAAETDFEVVDHSELLAGVAAHSPFIFDKDRTLWWTDAADGAVGSWRPGADPDFRPPGFWLPFTGTIDQLTHDAEGRVWIVGQGKTYYYADQRWWPGATLYPDIPDSTRLLAFSSRCSPAVVTSSDPSGLNLNARAWLHHAGRWSLLPDDRIIQPALSNSIGWLRFDRNDHLLMQRFPANNYQLWAYGAWTSFIITDFFPLPTRIYDIAVTDDQRVRFLTDVGLFTRSGQNYEFQSLSDFVEAGTILSGARMRYSPRGTLWIMYDRQLAYQKGEAFIQIPFEPNLSDESAPLSLFDVFRELHVYSDQDIWLTSTSFGVVHYNGDGMIHYTSENSGLPPTYFSDVARDDRGRTWLNGGRVIAILTPPEAETPLINAERAERALYLFPNPACCHTQARWQQPTDGRVTLSLYDSQGRLVRTILDETVAAGEQTAAVARDGLPAGMYLLILERAGERSTRRLIWE